MAPEYIASRLALLPHFEVASIEGESLVGFFSEPMPGDAFSANLFLPDLR